MPLVASPLTKWRIQYVALLMSAVDAFGSSRFACTTSDSARRVRSLSAMVFRVLKKFSAPRWSPTAPCSSCSTVRVSSPNTSWRWSTALGGSWPSLADTSSTLRSESASAPMRAGSASTSGFVSFRIGATTSVMTWRTPL